MPRLARAFSALAAVLLGVLPACAQGNLFPQTLPPNVVVGRLGIGPGPAQAIPFGTLFNNLPGASILTLAPPRTTLCNPAGIPGPVVACDAITAAPPLLITGTVLSVTGIFGTNNVFLGPAGNATLSGANNTATGFGALNAVTSGSSNAAYGTNALIANTTGASNSAFGGNALAANTTGNSNLAIGQGAMASNISGVSNACIGQNCLQQNTTGGFNVGVGFQSLLNQTTSSGNSAVGQASLADVTTGQQNAAVGNSAGRGITTGSNNSIFGGCTGLAAALANAIVLCDGANNVRLDWAKTAAATMTLQGPVVNVGTETATAHVVNGAVPTGNTGTCATGITVAGGATAGTWTSTAICALAGTIILTSMPAMPTGYACFVSDRTTAGVVVEQTTTTATSASFIVRALPTGTVATVANDILQYSCVGY